MSVPVTGNSTNSKYYNPPHIPISLPCQSAFNLSSKRFLRGEPLPLWEAGKIGISAYPFLRNGTRLEALSPGEHPHQSRLCGALAHRPLCIQPGSDRKVWSFQGPLPILLRD